MGPQFPRRPPSASSPSVPSPSRGARRTVADSDTNDTDLGTTSPQKLANELVRYGLVVIFNVVMWGCYVNSLKALSSLQATVTNFATNFLTSGLAGFFLFEELLAFKWFAGALFIVIGVLILSKSSIERKANID